MVDLGRYSGQHVFAQLDRSSGEGIPSLDFGLMGNVNSEYILDGCLNIYIVSCDVRLDFMKLHVDKVAIPKALKHVKRSTLFPVQKPQPDDVTVKEVDKGTQTTGEPRIDPLLQLTLHACLLAAADVRNRLVRHEAIFKVQQIDDLARRISVVFFRPPGQRIEIVVDDLA